MPKSKGSTSPNQIRNGATIMQMIGRGQVLVTLMRMVGRGTIEDHRRMRVGTEVRSMVMSAEMIGSLSPKAEGKSIAMIEGALRRTSALPGPGRGGPSALRRPRR